jgi:hypothetical protein
METLVVDGCDRERQDLPSLFDIVTPAEIHAHKQQSSDRVESEGASILQYDR